MANEFGDRPAKLTPDNTYVRIRDVYQWQLIETAPKDGTEVDIWVSGPGSRRVTNCAWRKPRGSNWGDRYGDGKVLPEQWVTRDGVSLDRRNGVPTHWMPLPNPPEA